MQDERPKLTLVIDPRFSGGTSSAVARELHAVAKTVDLAVHAISSKMFKGKTVNPRLQEAFDSLGITLVWDAPVITGDIVVVHNPSFLKFNKTLSTKIVCETLICVTHENFLTPQGLEGFDIDLCLDLLESSSITGSRYLSPVSPSNRTGVETWLSRGTRAWGVTPFNWFNICDFTFAEPTDAPADRRGRMSRPGWEKFPDMQMMMSHFPESSVNRILGGDSYLTDALTIPEHWEVMPFGAEAVDDFLNTIDFFVYFTSSRWKESFGRVIAEAIAAGKVVITDAATGANFAGAVMISDGTDVNEIIEDLIENPARYTRFVKKAQVTLSKFSQETFIATALHGSTQLKRGTHAIL